MQDAGLSQSCVLQPPFGKSLRLPILQTPCHQHAYTASTSMVMGSKSRNTLNCTHARYSATQEKTCKGAPASTASTQAVPAPAIHAMPPRSRPDAQAQPQAQVARASTSRLALYWAPRRDSPESAEIRWWRQGLFARKIPAQDLARPHSRRAGGCARHGGGNLF